MNEKITQYILDTLEWLDGDGIIVVDIDRVMELLKDRENVEYAYLKSIINGTEDEFWDGD